MIGVLFIFALLWMPPSLKATTIEEFSGPFDAVLENLMLNYWPVADDGDWMEDEAGYDGPQYSTELLYQLAEDTGNPLYTERANKTMEYVLSMADIAQILANLDNVEELMEVGASLPALIYGHRYYSGSSPYAFGTQVPFILSAAGQLIKSGQDFGLLNAFSAPGAVAYYDLLVAYSLRDKDKPGTASTMSRAAYSLLRHADAFWVQVDEDTGYYDAPSRMHGVWDEALILQALSLAYKASGNTDYLNRATHLLNALEESWDITEHPGYCDTPACALKYLSGNHLMCKALLVLFDATEDPRWLDRARETLEFMTSPETIYGTDPLFPAHQIFVHDWSADYGPNEWACSGCNFAVLGCIYEYNRLIQEGPGGVDLLPDCMIATSAYGTATHSKLGVLRTFRDRFLLTSEPGRAFVDLYYTHSPKAADWLSRHETAKGMVRLLLQPVIGLISLII
jgi:hypothetical protein